MNEEAVRFGINDDLHGILSMPDHEFSETKPIIVILNSGLLHKVGPFRLSVELARNLALSGYRVLRFDVSGIGDSNMRLAKAGEDNVVTDIMGAMNYLDSIFGDKHYVLIGLCSGADSSHRVSLIDERVVGSVHLDGYGYRNSAYFFYYFVPRLLSLRLLKKRIKVMFSDNKHVTQGLDEIEAYNRCFPSVDQAINEFSRIIGRGVKLLYIYTGGVENYYNHKGQLRSLLKSVDLQDALDEEYYPSADHTFSRVNCREKVIQRIVDWLTARFG